MGESPFFPTRLVILYLSTGSIKNHASSSSFASVPFHCSFQRFAICLSRFVPHSISHTHSNALLHILSLAQSLELVLCLLRYVSPISVAHPVSRSILHASPHSIVVPGMGFDRSLGSRWFLLQHQSVQHTTYKW